MPEQIKPVHQFEFGNAWIDCDEKSAAAIRTDGGTVRTLYAIPADQVLVPRELLERVAAFTETLYDREQRAKALEELRALLQQ